MNARRIAAFSVALIFVAGGMAARSIASHAPAQLNVDFAQPLVVVTGWHAYGAACVTVLAATVGCATLAALLTALRLPPPSRPGAVVALAAAAAIAAAWTWPFVFSSDVYAYAAYGATAAAGLDPYRAVASHAHGVFIDAARWQWSGTYPVCVYGPAFVALARGTFAIFGFAGVGATLWAFRAFAAAAFVASIAALAVALPRMHPRRRFVSLCAYGLNPVALWSVAEGHNDAFVLLAVFAGAALIGRGARLTGAGLAGLSALLKATGVALAAGLALDALVFMPAVRGRRIALATSVALAFAALTSLPPLLPALRMVRAGGRYVPTASLQGLLGVAPVVGLAIAALAYGGVRLRGRHQDGFAWLGIAAWLALPNAYPWYALWLLPAVLAAGEGFAAAALWGATISSVLRYLPDAVGELGTGSNAWLAVAIASPLLLATLALWPAPIRKKATSP